MNVLNHKNFELVFNGSVDDRGYDKKKLKAMSRCDRLMQNTIYSREIVNEDLVIFETEKRNVKYTRPIPVGVAILDLSKVLMANYYYNVFNRFWRCTLAYTDTDSFQLKLDTETFEEDILELGISQYFDFSNMDKDALVKEGNVYDRLLKQEKKDICTLVRKGQRGMTLREIYEYMDLDKIDVIHIEMDENDANNVLELTKEYIRKIDERDLELKRINLNCILKTKRSLIITSFRRWLKIVFLNLKMEMF